MPTEMVVDEGDEELGGRLLGDGPLALTVAFFCLVAREPVLRTRSLRIQRSTPVRGLIRDVCCPFLCGGITADLQAELLDALFLVSWQDIPQFHAAVETAGGQGVAVRAERHLEHLIYPDLDASIRRQGAPWTPWSAKTAWRQVVPSLTQSDFSWEGEAVEPVEDGLRVFARTHDLLP
jgi:hypothetical protein